MTVVSHRISQTAAFYSRTWTVDEERWQWDWQAPPLPLGHPPSPHRPRLGPVKVSLLASIAASAAAGRAREGTVCRKLTYRPQMPLKVNTHNAQLCVYVYVYVCSIFIHINKFQVWSALSGCRNTFYYQKECLNNKTEWAVWSRITSNCQTFVIYIFSFSWPF